MKTQHFKSILSICILQFTISTYTLAQVLPFNTAWEKTFGGSNVEFNDYVGNTLARTTDGGYAFTAMTRSNDGDVSGNHGGIDCWVVKINSTGNLLWQKCIGGSGDDYGKNLISTTDGGILVGGQTNSNDGDMDGNHGGDDIFIVKLSNNGNIEWKKTLGSNKTEDCYSFIEDPAGNFLIAGITNGNNCDVSGNHGKYDAWLVKLNPSGNILWQKCYGGNMDEGVPFNHGTSICNSAEGGYMLATTTASSNGQVTGFHPGPNGWVVDAWLVKVDVNGTIQWQNCFGTAANDLFENIMQTSSGDYIGSGLRNPRSEKEALLAYEGNDGFDWWICRISITGNIIWSNHYGGTGGEAIHNAVFELPNGDLIAPSGTRSSDFDCANSSIDINNPTDIWILKLTPSGNIVNSQIWSKTGYQNLSSAILDPDGSILVAALTDSANFTGCGYFCQDFTSASQIWIFKLQINPTDIYAITTNSISESQICPSINPTSISVNFSTRGTFNSGNVFTAQLSDANGSFASPVTIGSLADTSSGTISCTIPANLPTGNYYAIRIASSNPPFTGISSGKFISIHCLAPLPNIAANVSATNASLSWSECINSNKNQLKYRKYVSSNWNSINTTGNSITVSLLQPSTTYVWAVRTKCLDNPLTWSDWSEEMTFTTTSLRIASSNNSIDSQINLIPNPVSPETSESTTISFSLSQSQNVLMQLFGVNGKLISTLANSAFTEGEHQIEFSAEKLNAGIYFLKMQSGGDVKTVKLVVAK